MGIYTVQEMNGKLQEQNKRGAKITLEKIGATFEIYGFVKRMHA